MTSSHGIPAGCSWSGGKDSCYALHKCAEAGSEIKVLVNMMNENGRISRSHGLPEKFLLDQASRLSIPILLVATSWTDYQQHFTRTLQEVKKKYDLKDMIFGDIDLQAHRDWEEMVCAEANLNALLPLWQLSRIETVNNLLQTGIRSTIVSCNDLMGPDFLGKQISPALVEELVHLGIDACGENGEYHTAVTDCPLFSSPVELPAFEKVKHENYWFLHWI